MFLMMFFKTQNIGQTMHLTMLIAHPYSSLTIHIEVIWTLVALYGAGKSENLNGLSENLKKWHKLLAGSIIVHHQVNGSHRS